MEKNLFNVLTSSTHAKQIDKIIRHAFINGFPYLKGLLLSDTLALESPWSLPQAFQRLTTLMEHYYDRFPVKLTRQSEERTFRIQFNLLMGLDSTHLIVKNYLSTQPTYDILLPRNYQGDNVMALLHKKSINHPGNQAQYRLVLERIFQIHVPLILGLNNQNRFILSENILYFFHLVPQINNIVTIFMTLFAFSLACHQGTISAEIKAKLEYHRYLENIKYLFYLCQKLIEYGAYFELSNYIPSLPTELLFKLRESAWNLGDFNCFHVIHSMLHKENLNYTHLLNKNYYPVAIKLVMDLDLIILQLSSEMIRRVLSSIFLSEDDELLMLFFKKWNQQLQFVKSIHQSLVVEQGNEIVGTLLQKNKLLGEKALFKLMHGLLSHQVISLEKKYYPYYIKRFLDRKRTLFELANLCHLPHLIKVLLKLGASRGQPTSKSAFNDSRNVRQSYQSLLSLNLCQSHRPLNARELISAIPAVVLRSAPEVKPAGHSVHPMSISTHYG